MRDWKFITKSSHKLKAKNEGSARLAGERFETFKDAVGKFRLRLKAQNLEIYSIVENSSVRVEPSRTKAHAAGFSPENSERILRIKK